MHFLRLPVLSCGLAASVIAANAEPMPPAASQVAGIAPTTATPPVRDKLNLTMIAIREAKQAGLPSSLVDAVMKIESDYRPDRVGDVGEIGLMQVRPTTAAMLGFKGTANELADPATNIHYGAAYLGTAWRLAKGNVCRALMKYRAGHGNETMTPLSVSYCQRAQVHLASIGSPLAATITPADLVADTLIDVAKQDVGGATVARLKQGRTPADTILPGETLTVGGRPKTGPAFWAAFQTRIKRINSGLEAKWRRSASR